MPLQHKRFWSKVDRSGGPDACWPWTAASDYQGYGLFRTGSRTDGSRRMVQAHRYAYECLVGPIPTGLELDHVCRNPPCVNTAHLQAVTHIENVRRGRSGAWWAAKTHCPSGHEYAGANLYVRPNGYRECRACQREYKRRVQLSR